MNQLITKSDFLKYLECPAYFWFHKRRPAMIKHHALSDFAKELIRNGNEVELWARKLFPSGTLVESRQEQAVEDTKRFLEAGKQVIFQATFEANGLYVMVDILKWDEKEQYWVINEVKGSSSKEVKKEEHIQDAAFQYFVLREAGMDVGEVNLIELNKAFRKKGEINPVKLLAITDITLLAEGHQRDIKLMSEDMELIMKRDKEPMPCDCIYKARKHQCPVFKYLHPEVPEYSVHDITLIGNSLKNLEKLVEADYLSIDDVPSDFKLSPLQRNHVDVTQKKKPIIKTAQIKKRLEELVYPLYFLDYETIPTGVPIYEGCGPFQQVPFQYSLHIQKVPGSELEHHEYLHTESGTHPMKALSKDLIKHIGKKGSVIVWSKKFEGKCHTDIAELIPELAEAFVGYNKRFFDLMEIFSKNLYVHHEFRGSHSIKAVLPVLVPEMSYKTLNIQDGAMAMSSWKKMMFDSLDDFEKDKISKDLLEYCKQDTYAMVKILEVLSRLVR